MTDDKMDTADTTLPPLPEPDTWSWPSYSDESMKAYATAAVAAEREACAKLCDDEALVITASMIRERSAV